MYISIFVYITLLIFGSVLGYYKAASVASLVMGLSFAALITLFTLLLRQGKTWAGQVLLVVVLALDFFFSWRYMKTHQLMPAGLFSILTSILLIIIYLRLKKRSS